MLARFSLSWRLAGGTSRKCRQSAAARVRPSLNPLGISGCQPRSAVNVRFGRLHSESRQSAFGQYRPFRLPSHPAIRGTGKRTLVQGTTLR